MPEFKKILTHNFELMFWLSAVPALACSNPYQAAHFELCPLKLLGLTWCPGCGLGHAISFLFHGQIIRSIHAHWLGIPAVVIIFNRILFLFPTFYKFKKT